MNKTISLLDVLPAAAIETDLKGATKAEILGELTALLVRAGIVADGPAVLKAVQAREELGSTGCGDGVAVPHARIDGLEKTVLALGISKAGIAFGGVDNEPVKIFFLLLGPQKDPEGYLRTLSQVAKLIKDPEFRINLAASPDAESVLSLIRAAA